MAGDGDGDNNVRKIPTWLCSGEFDEGMLESFIDFYNDVVGGNYKNAIIYIDSIGGDISVVNSMLSLIELTPVTFHTTAIGSALSCGLYLLVGGDVRYATDRAQLMYHATSLETFGDLKSLKEEINRHLVLSNKMTEKFAAKTKKDAEWWDSQPSKADSKEFWMDAKKAKSLGVIDHIGIPMENQRIITEVGVQYDN
jgi:ATP-dependent protease ClpP protease subunit